MRKLQAAKFLHNFEPVSVLDSLTASPARPISGVIIWFPSSLIAAKAPIHWHIHTACTQGLSLSVKLLLTAEILKYPKTLTAAPYFTRITFS